MARRKDGLDREALREKLIAVAEALVLQGGKSALTARALAAHIGYSLGHIYNLVSDIDELIVLVNSRTLLRLQDALDDALEGQTGAARLQAVAVCYVEFTLRHFKLWQLVDDMPALPEDDEYLALIATLPSYIGTEIKALRPHLSPEDLRRDVALLWSSLQGMTHLSRSGHLALLESATPQSLASRCITLYLSQSEKA